MTMIDGWKEISTSNDGLERKKMLFDTEFHSIQLDIQSKS